MKRVIGILMAAALSLGLLAGCGGEKMSEEEKAYKAACKTFTYEELDNLSQKTQGVQVTGKVNGHAKDGDGKPMLYIETEDNKFIEIYSDEADLYKDGQKITAWGYKVGITTKEGIDGTFPSIEAEYIEKVK